MNDAVAQYKTNIIMKTAVDRVQLKNECCGSVTYLEWFNKPWIDDAYIPRNAYVRRRAISYRHTFTRMKYKRTWRKNNWLLTEIESSEIAELVCNFGAHVGGSV